MNTSPTPITVSVTVNVRVEKAWNYFTQPEHITQWCFAIDAWHAPRAENDLRAGGKFLTRMEAKDGSAGFDFTGVYNEVKLHEFFSYTMEDGRKVKVSFSEKDNATIITETFDPESANPIEMQRNGWQAILENFKKYAEAK